MTEPSPLYHHDLVHIIAQHLHPKDLINLHATSKFHNMIFDKPYIIRHNAAIKIQKCFKRYRERNTLRVTFLNKLLSDPFFRIKYLYIHEPEEENINIDLDDCATFPHVCLKEAVTIDPFFVKVFGGPLEFSDWFDTQIDKSLQNTIQAKILNLPDKPSRYKLLKEAIFI